MKMIGLIMAGMLAFAPAIAFAQAADTAPPTDQDFFKIGQSYAAQHPIAPKCYRQSMALTGGTDAALATDAALTPAESVTANIAVGKVLYVSAVSIQTINNVDETNTQIIIQALIGKVSEDDFAKAEGQLLGVRVQAVANLYKLSSNLTACDF